MTLADLRDAIAGKCSKRDQVLVLIEACIGDGIITRREIIDTIGSLGYDRIHAVITLNDHAGLDPQRHRWCRDENGHYSLLS